MEKKEILKMRYDEVFYNTIGLIDSVIVRMIKDLLEFDNNCICSNIIRNYECYNDSKLILRFDNKLNNNSFFVDVRLNYDNYCGMLEDNIRNSIIISSKIFDNTNCLKPENYKYIRIDFGMLYDNKIYKRILFCSDDGSTKLDGWQVFYYNTLEAYNKYMKSFNDDIMDIKIRWLTMLECTNFFDLDKIIGNDLLNVEEKKNLYDNIQKVNLNKNIINRVDEINYKENKYNYIYAVGQNDGKKKLENEIVNKLRDKGISEIFINELFNFDN